MALLHSHDIYLADGGMIGTILHEALDFSDVHLPNAFSDDFCSSDALLQSQPNVTSNNKRYVHCCFVILLVLFHNSKEIEYKWTNQKSNS